MEYEQWASKGARGSETLPDVPRPPSLPPSELAAAAKKKQLLIFGGIGAALLLVLVICVIFATSGNGKYPAGCVQMQDAQSILSGGNPTQADLSGQLTADIHQALVLDGGWKNFGGAAGDAYLQATLASSQLALGVDDSQAVQQMKFDVTTALQACP